MLTTPKTRREPLDRPLDLRLTLAPLRTGKGDPCTRLRSDEAYRATRTPAGPAMVHVLCRDGEVAAEAWGDGAEWALDQLPVLLGSADLDDFETDHALVADLHRSMPGLRIGATHRVLEALLVAVCGQGVSAFEAKRSYHQIMAAFGEPAPGPPQLGLLVPPGAQVLASTSHQDFHPLGLEQARSDIIRRAAARAASIEGIVDIPPSEADARLRAIAGIRGWATAIVRQTALGDPDAVPVGDARLPHIVAWALTGERQGSDALMLELLEQFRGHRGRVVRLLKAAGLVPPRRSH